MIDHGLPNVDDFVSSEIETLKFLKDHKYIYENYVELYSDASTAFYKYDGTKKIHTFDFESSLQLFFENQYRQVFVGGKVSTNNNKYSNLTYYFAICGNNNDKKIMLRKFHFDYTVPAIARRTPHPIFHLQYCGKLSPSLSRKGLNNENLFPGLSTPRLIFIPISLALMLNILFKENENDSTIKIINDPTWQAIVRNNENLLIKPFFETCLDLLKQREDKNNTNYKKLLTSNLYYAE